MRREPVPRGPAPTPTRRHRSACSADAAVLARVAPARLGTELIEREREMRSVDLGIFRRGGVAESFS